MLNKHWLISVRAFTWVWGEEAWVGGQEWKQRWTGRIKLHRSGVSGKVEISGDLASTLLAPRMETSLQGAGIQDSGANLALYYYISMVGILWHDGRFC